MAGPQRVLYHLSDGLPYHKGRSPAMHAWNKSRKAASGNSVDSNPTLWTKSISCSILRLNFETLRRLIFLAPVVVSKLTDCETGKLVLADG
jgi:hypothetical protein